MPANSSGILTFVGTKKTNHILYTMLQWENSNHLKQFSFYSKQVMFLISTK